MAIEIINKTGYGFPITRRADSSADHASLPNSCYFEQTDLGGLVRYKNNGGLVIDAFVNIPNVQTVASASNVTANVDTDNIVVITDQATGLTLDNPSGTPVQGQALFYRIKDNGVSRTVAYGSQFRAIGVTLPTSTTISKTIYLGCIYNSTESKWDVIGVNIQA
jgi:hypothetical protein